MDYPPAMNDHTLQVLEYPRLLALLAEYAASPAGRAALLAIRPATTPAAAFAERPLHAAFLRLRELGFEPHRADFDLPAEALARVAPVGAVLDTDELLALRRLLRQLHQVRRCLGSDLCQQAPPVVTFRAALPELNDLLRRLDRVFDDQGRLQDDATDALAELRRRVRQLERKISQRLEALLHESDLADVFADRYVALRNNRYVIPIPRENRGRVRGVVHDQSNSGRTIFMEPEATLADGNELATARLEERDEILRLLAALSDQVRAALPELQAAAALLTRYDVAFAISAWAETFRCCYPEPAPRLALQHARHPLLAQQFRQRGQEDALVPLDLELPADCRVLAVTGSNTGGKTVVLKTVGLLALAFQSGLPLPVRPESTLPFFPQILADIGDEQSLQQNLSTFSGHLRQVSAILAAAAAQPALVLLDELGSGTDPIEGGALGCAILDTLAKSQALALVTTHLGMIKTHVHNQPRMGNASVRFNAETLQPEYVLEVGRPGASHALTIAGRLGIPQPVLAAARAHLSSDQLNLEQLLASVELKERQLQQDLAVAQAARDKAVAERDQLHQELAALRQQRRELLHQAQREAGAIVDNTRRQMDSLLQQARQAKADDAAKELRKSVEAKREKLKQGIATSAPRPPQRLAPAALEVGQKVWVAVLNDHAIIVALSDDKQRATIDCAGKRFELRSNQLSARRPDAEEPAPARTTVHKPSPSRAVRLELNVIGLRVDEAIPQVERFLDEAMLAGLDQVRIIHGFGTGQLRKGLHEYLEGSPAVDSFRLGLPDKDPGGAGATYVQLA
jgi:DNA mismatch repair protein MutS2